MPGRNNVFWLFVFGLVMLKPALSAEESHFSYTGNTFIKWDDCMAVYPGTTLTLGEKVTVFSRYEAPGVKEIVHSISAEKARRKFDELGFNKVYADKPLWNEVQCFHAFRGEIPEVLVRVTPGSEEYPGLGFGIRGLPVDALITGGAGELVNQQAASSYIKLVRHMVTDACYAPDSLVRARKFPAQRGHTIIQLDIGKAELDTSEKGGFQCVEICRFFLHNERVIQTERISRRSDQEERVATGPPDLNAKNWANTTETAIGFISLNAGKDWDVLIVDGGFEGINYLVQRLGGSVDHYSMYLYTHH